MYTSYKQVSEFSLEGKILSLIIEDGYKLKYLQISCDRGVEFLVKLCKELRASLSLVLTPGLRVQIAGEKEHNLKNGKIKLKAYSLKLCGSNNQGLQQLDRPKPPQTPKAATKTKAKILICQKSDCQKRGGTAICKALEDALNSRGLAEQVTVQGTGCLKQCKAGPNIVVMPDKTRYSRIKPAQIPAILDKHFTV